MKFPYLLFDADDTLFDFSKSRGPCLFCHVPEQRRSGYAGYPRLYHRINQELWAAFDRGEVSKDYVTWSVLCAFFRR